MRDVFEFRRLVPLLVNLLAVNDECTRHARVSNYNLLLKLNFLWEIKHVNL